MCLSNRLFVFVLRYSTNIKESFLPSQGDTSLQQDLCFYHTLGREYYETVLSYLSIYCIDLALCVENIVPKVSGN